MNDKPELDVAKPALAAIADASPERDVWIGDRSFIAQLTRLKNLRQFLHAAGVPVNLDDTSVLADFSALRFKKGGRWPEAKEWRDLEWSSQKLYSYLTDESLRRKFFVSEAPGIIAWLPVALGIIALVALTLAILVPNFSSGFISRLLSFGIDLPPSSHDNSERFVCYIYWMASLGGLGAIAFISVNTLSIQATATFDVNNERLILVRVILGALFGTVLSIAFGFPSFLSFCTQVTGGGVHGMAPPSSGASTASSANLVGSSAMLLLPFILGFSTTLVITILNRFVESVGMFFGAAPASAATEGPSAVGSAQGKVAAAGQGIAPAG